MDSEAVSSIAAFCCAVVLCSCCDEPKVGFARRSGKSSLSGLVVEVAPLSSLAGACEAVWATWKLTPRMRKGERVDNDDDELDVEVDLLGAVQESRRTDGESSKRSGGRPSESALGEKRGNYRVASTSIAYTAK